jgi:hypothetical protein
MFSQPVNLGVNMLTKSPRLKFLKPHCTRTQPCPKCSLLLVIRYRFRAFREQFGREPKPTEPLFFDHSKSRPLKVSLSEAREQIEGAATAVGITAVPLLRFLKLDSSISEQKADHTVKGRIQLVTNDASSGQPVNRVLANRPWPKPHSVWERFIRNERLHRDHQITPEELKTLCGLAMMGRIRSSRDILYMLNLIREHTKQR